MLKAFFVFVFFKLHLSGLYKCQFCRWQVTQRTFNAWWMINSFKGELKT